MTIIPADELRPETLQAVLEEFVTREGAVHGHRDVPVESQISTLLRQVRSGAAMIVYDEATESCGVVTAEQLKQLRSLSTGEIQPAGDSSPE